MLAPGPDDRWRRSATPASRARRRSRWPRSGGSRSRRSRRRTRSTRTCGAARWNAARSRIRGSRRRRMRSSGRPRRRTGRSEPAEIEIGFERGVPVSVDGEAKDLPAIVRALDALAGAYGFGRVDMIENRRIGIKSRELYEVPGALAIILAHRALEDLTLERDVAHHKPGIEARWAELVYDGQWFAPLREAIDAYVASDAVSVTGDVRLRLRAGHVHGGRQAPAAHSLYDLSLATYGAGRRVRSVGRAGLPAALRGCRSAVWAAKQAAGRTDERERRRRAAVGRPVLDAAGAGGAALGRSIAFDVRLASAGRRRRRSRTCAPLETPALLERRGRRSARGGARSTSAARSLERRFAFDDRRRRRPLGDRAGRDRSARRPRGAAARGPLAQRPRR